jgi:hypothetical protein
LLTPWQLPAGVTVEIRLHTHLGGQIMRTRTPYLAISLIIVVGLPLTGCGGATKKLPPNQMVQDVVSASLPPFLTLDAIESEAIPLGPEDVKVNFKATVTPKEDLCAVDREVEGTPKVTLLKVVQPAGTKSSLYGSVEGRRIVDRWTFSPPRLQVGFEQFGKPRGAFGAQSYISGSEAANAALKDQAANAERIERDRKAALLKQELERKAQEEEQARQEKARQDQLARDEKARQDRAEQARIELEKQKAILAEQQRKEEEQRQKAEEAARQKLLLATAPGIRYLGSMTSGDKSQHVRIVFTEQKGFLIRAEVTNPDNSKEKRTFTGQLHFPSQPGDTAAIDYPITMNGLPGGTWCSYAVVLVDMGYLPSLKLRLTDKGLEGEAITASQASTIRLQRER